MKKRYGLLILFVLVWIASIGLGSFFVGQSCSRQIRATGFATTTGTVTSSKITTHRGKRTSYGVDIRYTYTVGGRIFTGENYRYGQMSYAGSAWAKDAVRLHPAGAPTIVY